MYRAFSHHNDFFFFYVLVNTISFISPSSSKIADWTQFLWSGLQTIFVFWAKMNSSSANVFEFGLAEILSSVKKE